MRLSKPKRSSQSFYKKFPDERDAWLLSYADIITMLLCFFVLFFSTEKRKTTGEFSEVMSFIKDELGLKNAQGTNLKNVKELIKSRYGDEKIVSELERLNIKGKVQILSYKHYVSIDFPNGNMFNKGSDKLTPKAKEELAPVFKALKNYKDKLHINIVAYTDPSPVNPNPTLQRWWNNNRELSAQRALNVQSLFLEQGFPQDMVYITGKGIMAGPSSKEQTPLSLDGNQVDTKTFNSARTISIRLESKDKQ